MEYTMQASIKITPSPASQAVYLDPGALLLAVLRGEPEHLFMVAYPDEGDFHVAAHHPVTIAELREDGEESVEVWYRGVRLGIVDLTAWAKLGGA